VVLEGVQRLPVALEQLVEQASPGGVGKGFEHRIHAREDR
jgi:hypothetical protein